MHHGLSGVHQCTIGYQVETSAPWASKWYAAIFFFQAEDGIRDLVRSRGLGDVYKRQSALWAIRCTPVHYGQSGVHQCTMGKQVYTGALWAIRCTPVRCGQSGVHWCTMGNQVYTTALYAIRCITMHHGLSGVHQCTMGNQERVQLNLGVQAGSLFGKISRGREIFSVDPTVCKLQTC